VSDSRAATGEPQRPKDSWASGDAYEPYVGRWSRKIAPLFLDWLAIPAGGAWVDVGCGTGALTSAILERTSPRAVTGIDPSAGYLAHARDHVRDPRARFAVGDAQALEIETGSCDAAVSGLVINFVPEPARMIAEMKRVVKAGGTVAVYVWDYAGGMEMLKRFWDAAIETNPAAAGLHEGTRFSLCAPEPLAHLLREAGLASVETRALDSVARFERFDDFWTPFLGGQGPGASYLMSLDDAGRVELRERVRSRLPVRADGSFELSSRAWAARGTGT
jgi:SAM-dependent methyltransferase